MNWIDRNSTRIVISGIIISLVMGAAIAIHAGSVLRYPDEREWTQLAANLARKHTYTLDGIHATAIRPPGYPCLLALSVAIGIGNTGLRLVNLSMFLLSEVLLVMLARRLFSRCAAAISILLVLFYPVLAYVATLLLPQTFGAALLLLGIWLLIRVETPSAWSIILAGLAWGLLILTIPTFIFVLVCCVAWLLWKRRDFRRKVFPLAAPLILLVGAWTARNYVEFHTFFFVASSSGMNLLIGNSENSTMASGAYTDLNRYVTAASGMSEVEADKYYKASAVAWIKENPGTALRLYVLKFIEYFSFTERIVTGNFATKAEQPFWRSLIMLFTYEPLLFLLIARIAVARRYPLSEVEILLAGLYFLNALFAAVFFTRIRYRLPMDWILLLLDAGTIQIIFSRLFSSRAILDKEVGAI
jgi:4-amino-4-deoxy-L-arabinose transferase-like glycosyltransferase